MSPLILICINARTVSVLSNRSTVKVHTQPRSPKDHACDVVNYLSSVLFPPGISNAPIEQLQQFYGAAVANRMVSANDIDKRNLAKSAAPSDSGLFLRCVLYPCTIVVRAVTVLLDIGVNSTGLQSNLLLSRGLCAPCGAGASLSLIHI